MIARLVLTLVMFAAFALGASPLGASAASSAGMPSCKAGDPVVWVNTKSHVYHMQGDKYYGKTKSGDYECASAATAAGNRASGAKTKSATASSSAAMSGSTSAPSAMESPSMQKKKHRTKNAAPTVSPTP